MRERRGSFEVVLTDGQRTVLDEPEGGAAYTFRALSLDEKLVAGLECTLRTSDAEHLVRVDRIDGSDVTLWSERPVALKDGHAVLVIYPWFLYDKTSQGARGDRPASLCGRAGDDAVRQARRHVRAPGIDPGARVSERQPACRRPTLLGQRSVVRVGTARHRQNDDPRPHRQRTAGTGAAGARPVHDQCRTGSGAREDRGGP